MGIDGFVALSAPKFNIVNTVQHGAGAESLLADNSPAILSMSAFSLLSTVTPAIQDWGAFMPHPCLIHR
jgi:hypothetical protein